MSSLKKKCQVVMLSTEEKAIINLLVLFNKSNHLSVVNRIEMQDFLKIWTTEGLLVEKDSSIQGVYQHLYILSDDEIKEGDWYYDLIYENIFQWKGKPVISQNQKKIIATTDISLNYIKHDESVPYPKGEQIFLPQPSPQFISKFIEEYNKGNVITDVMVEYEDVLNYINAEKGNFKPNLVLKVDKNNYITITKLKDSWSRDELEILKLAFEDSKNYVRNHDYREQCVQRIFSWIENNL